MPRSLLALAIVAMFASATGCGPSTPPSATAEHTDGHAGHDHKIAPMCAEFAKACHGAEGQVAHDCHMLGHDPKTTPEQCEAKHHECMAACSGGAPAGASSAAPAHP